MVFIPEAQPRRNKPLDNSAKNRARGYRLLGELYRLADLRLSRKTAPNWQKWAYCVAATLFAVAPGREKRPNIHKGALIQGVTYSCWPECTLDAILKPPLFPSREAVPPEVIEDILNGILRASLSPHRGMFPPGDAIGRWLNVTREEIEHLGLRLVNGVDFTSADRREKRRKSSVQRSEKHRRESGSKPRKTCGGQSISTVKPWVSLGISRASFYRKSEKERQEVIEKLALTLAGKN